MTSLNSQPARCGIILAGGEGKRLRTFVRCLLGFDLPKQYVNFYGTKSMLERALDRARCLISPEQVFTVVAKDHLYHAEVQRQLDSRSPETLVLQPANRETGPGLLLPLMHVYKRYGNATVAVFPSDHFIHRQDLFNSYVSQAFDTVGRCPNRIVFLGVEPTGPEPQYGYIIPRYEQQDSSPAQDIQAFIEKPEPRMIPEIIALGALWNTMVMVFRVKTFMHLVEVSAPRLHSSFQRILDSIGSPFEQSTIEEIYRNLEPVNLSKDLLEIFDSHSENQLSVISMKGVYWSDWGSEDRILSDLESFNLPDRSQNPEEIPIFAAMSLEASL